MLASKLQDNDKFFEKEYNVKIHKSKWQSSYTFYMIKFAKK
jgi:hypothetical protein